MWMQVSNAYRALPYHNFWHVSDVAFTTFRFISLTQRHTSMTPLEKLAVMVAAICHDMDHPGEIAHARVCEGAET